MGRSVPVGDVAVDTRTTAVLVVRLRADRFTQQRRTKLLDRGPAAGAGCRRATWSTALAATRSTWSTARAATWSTARAATWSTARVATWSTGAAARAATWAAGSSWAATGGRITHGSPYGRTHRRRGSDEDDDIIACVHDAEARASTKRVVRSSTVRTSDENCESGEPHTPRWLSSRHAGVPPGRR